MKAELEKSIVECLHELDDAELSEVFDFVEFIRFRRVAASPDARALAAVRGKYRNLLSSSEEFARRKEEEIRLEEEKWQR
jgi:hypothetical protein